MMKRFWWARASVGLMLVGAFGPWAKVLVITIHGTDDGKDGWIVFGAAVSDINATFGGGIASAEWGIYLSLVASLSLILASLALVFGRRTETQVAVAPESA